MAILISVRNCCLKPLPRPFRAGFFAGSFRCRRGFLPRSSALALAVTKTVP